MSTIADRVINRVAGPDEPEEERGEEVGELEVSEYVVFLLALDTYNRYIEEVEGEDVEDDLVRKGISLIRRADRKYRDSIHEFLEEKVVTPSQKKMIHRAFNFKPNAFGMSRRTIWVRTAISRGGTSTMRAIFKKNLALRKVREAVEASMMDDADSALDKFASIPMRNALLRKWIKDASKIAGSGDYQNAVAISSDESADDVAPIMTSRVQQQGEAPTSEKSQEAGGSGDDLISSVQEKATEAAVQAMEVSGEEDKPPVKSEVIGIATAAAVAALTDPDNPQNIPEPLKDLDDEQRAAALTDGRVLVAAGAGAGKSTTVVSRVEYLIKDRRVNPSRVMVTSFNSKAASELKQKIGTATSGDILDQMSVGTMHSLFRKFIGEYGTAQERSAMGLGKNRGGFVQGGAPVARAVQRIWADCYGGSDEEEGSSAPKLKNVMMAKSKWAGNNITPAEAQKNAETTEEMEAAQWYEMYEGLKGSIPNWRPSCGRSKAYESFMGRFRPNGERLGDFDDMLGIFDAILKREPPVKKTLQGMFDHIIVDEAQDLSGVQFSIISQISEHVSDGKDGKSLWICGDDKQSIYGFRGARPDLFTNLNKTEGWKTQMIRTNYRCQPEIVEAANRLIAFNEDQIPMEAAPAPSKTRGVASVRVETSEDEASAALGVVEEIKASLEADGEVTDNAILTRTNKEQHSYETACIIRGIPYARKGAASFLGSPETKAFLSYVQLATGSDFGKMQAALGEVINKPNRFFVSPDHGVNAVKDAISEYARRVGKNLKDVHPMDAMSDYSFVDILAAKLARSRSGFKFNKTVEKLNELQQDITQMRLNAEDDAYTTKDMFDDILNMRGTNAVTQNGRAVYVEQTFRDSLKVDLRDRTDEDADDEEDEDEESENSGLGNISFLYELAKPDPTDPEDLISDPNSPMGFKAKMERYASKARDLRVDITKWEKAQAALPPEQRKAPPGVYLGTVHCSPADEPVFTTDGWVSIGELDPDKHRLTSYASNCNQLFWGDPKSGHEGPGGYGFVKGVMPYKGPLLTLTTLQSRTRLTPDHRIRVKWSETFYNKYVVYLMRRGDWWRIGIAKSGDRPYGGSDFKQRVSAEKADACWLLGVYETRTEAVLEETRLQGYYGVTGATFEAGNQRRVNTEQLHALHEAIKVPTQERVERLLADHGLDKCNPLYEGGPDRATDMRSAFTIQARNCLSGYMLLPVVPKAFVDRTGPRDVWTKPEWHEVKVTTEPFEGDVYSLAVPPHHFYVSGGAIVHNSVKGAQWKNCYVSMPKGKFPFEPPVKPGAPPKPPEIAKEEMESERRLGYVALTRAAMNLTVVCPSQVGGKPAGVSPFVDEAGLSVGENVTKPGAETVDDVPGVKTASSLDYEGVTPDDWDEAKDWSA